MGAGTFRRRGGRAEAAGGNVKNRRREKDGAGRFAGASVHARAGGCAGKRALPDAARGAKQGRGRFSGTSVHARAGGHAGKRALPDAARGVKQGRGRFADASAHARAGGRAGKRGAAGCGTRRKAGPGAFFGRFCARPRRRVRRERGRCRARHAEQSRAGGVLHALLRAPGRGRAAFPVWRRGPRGILVTAHGAAGRPRRKGGGWLCVQGFARCSRCFWLCSAHWCAA